MFKVVTAFDQGKARKIGLFTATAIVVANMVGTGIFGSLGFQVAGIPSGFPILLLWFTGGVLSLCGALCYCELAAMFPRSGGEYQLLNCSWPPWVGFLSGWISITAGFTAPIAVNATLLGSYLEAISSIDKLWFAIPILVLVSLVHIGKISGIALFQSGFTSAKIALILTLVVLGFCLGQKQPISFLPVAGDTELVFSSAFGVSLVYVLYAYAGWNAATYMMDEVKDPVRIVPRAILIGTLLVTVLYIAVNAAFLYSTPIESLSGQAEAGLISAQAILGEDRGKLMGLLIAFGLISTISSMTWAGPRVTAAIGRDYPLFSKFTQLNRNGVPAIAIATQTAIAIVLILTSSYDQLIHYISALLTISSIAVVLGMVVLRIRRPDLKRPFRCPLYPLPPIVFLLISGYVLYFQVDQRPTECLGGLATLLVGLVIYLIIRNRSSGELLNKK